MNRSEQETRSAAAILAEIASVGSPIAGTLSTTERKLQDGTTSTYYTLQRWRDGRNECVYVPEGKVRAVREGIENHKRMEALVAELCGAGLSSALAEGGEDPESKKKPSSSQRSKTALASARRRPSKPLKK